MRFNWPHNKFDIRLYHKIPCLKNQTTVDEIGDPEATQRACRQLLAVIFKHILSLDLHCSY